MALPPVLKPRHGLHGKRITPVALKLQTCNCDELDTALLARLKKDHPLVDYSLSELTSEFHSLTGETVEDILTLAGKSINIDNVRLLIHYTIIYANDVGAPKRQPLSTQTGNGNSGGSSAPDITGNKADHGADIAARLEVVEKSMTDMKSQHNDVEEALRQNSIHGKRDRFSPDIPPWELEIKFDPVSVVGSKRKVNWVNYRGGVLQPSPLVPSAEDLVKLDCPFDLECLPLRDPESFVPGALHDHGEMWEILNISEEVRDWIKEKINVTKLFKHFKGNYKGRNFDTDTPPKMYYPNAPSCVGFKEFVVKTLLDRLANGSLELLGRVGQCQPPHLVLPLVVEPTKPRLCHDERFLNLWVKDLPFKLDTLKDVPRLVDRDSFMTSIDDKSGYDHILLHDDSKTFFGLQFGGWYMVFDTLPFGFKASAYIYHMVGLAAVSHCRSLGVPCLQYIDDRLISELKLKSSGVACAPGSSKRNAVKALYVVCEVLTRLGYTIGLKKCVFSPCQSLTFLGMVIDSGKQAFLLPPGKKVKFACLRDSILSSKTVDVKTLQRFAGKCISFVLGVPAAKLYTSEVNRAISAGIRSSRAVLVEGGLREEIEHWLFLDSWAGFIPWRDEKHLNISIASDSSVYKWGAIVDLEGDHATLSDYWESDDSSPIHVKEARALLNALRAVKTKLLDHRVDAYVDNKALIGTWENQGRKDPALNGVVKEIYRFTAECNIALKLYYVPSISNPADKPSRSLNFQDCMLASDKWGLVQSRFGPHTCDAMALDSNAMRDKQGRVLKHFTPYPSPESAGVNIFAQDITLEDNVYVFPPFGLVAPLLKFLISQKVEKATVILPVLNPLPVWWPCFWPHVLSFFVLARKSEVGAILIPSKRGFVLDNRGLRCDILAVRLNCIKGMNV